MSPCFRGFPRYESKNARYSDKNPDKIKERHGICTMEIALIADDAKKELMTQFCIAYCGILSKHKLCSTSITGRYIAEATGLEFEKLLPGSHGGVQQICSRVSYNEIDVVLFFRSPDWDAVSKEEEYELLRACDTQNIPIATNIATAEVLITALDRGDLDWREIVNPKSDYNRKKMKRF